MADQSREKYRGCLLGSAVGDALSPGYTCISALKSGRMGAVEQPLNDSKGCGGVVRVSPVGFAFPGMPELALEVGIRIAAVTHGNPGGYVPAGFLAALLPRLVAGERLDEAVLVEGWIGDEDLAIGVYCALRHESSFEEGILAAVNHSGDSDSRGAVAGAILGARLGEKAIPPRWPDPLEVKGNIESVAEQLFDTFHGGQVQ